MALKANKTVIALRVQTGPDVFNAPTTGDLLPVANLTLTETGVTIDNPEYTGAVDKQGAIVAGSNVTLTFDVMMRPPGGGTVPAADTYLPGRLLRAAKMTEVRLASAVPAAPEALSAGTTSQATLGAGAAATADLYKALAINLSSQGSYPRSLTAIRSYSAGKVATFAETFGSALSGNYQIPSQLAYVRDVSSNDPPFLSQRVWLDGYRFDLINMSCNVDLVVPASTRDQAQFPVYRFTLTGDVLATADEPTPTIPQLGTIPLFKDGDFWLAGQAIGGSNFTISSGARTAAAPNPNKTNGSDAPETVEIRPTVSVSAQKYLKAVFDSRALATLQSQNAIWAQWGYTAGNIVGVVVTDARANFPSPEIGGDFILDNIQFFVDVAPRNVGIYFPY